MKHLFMVNPVAGGKKGRFAETEREIKALTESLDEPYEIYLTKAPMDAVAKITGDAQSEEMLRVYACGGDGTLNECANGAANRANVAITQYPCGTGNDFIRMFGQENVLKFRDLRALLAGVSRPIDIIDCGGRYGINICSVGIDARVGADVHKYSRIPLIGGSTGYVVSLVVNTLKGVKQKLRVTYGEVSEERYITMVCACNGRYYGGGFNPVPEALPDDGVIEFLIVEGVSRLKVANVVGKYAKGRYRELTDIITHIRGEGIKIEGEKEFVVGFDGESMRAKEVMFRVIPGGINFIFPEGMEDTWRGQANPEAAHANNDDMPQ